MGFLCLTFPKACVMINDVVGRRCTTNGRMAQLVEHIVHIDGVTGSSPVATTTSRKPLKSRASGFSFCPFLRLFSTPKTDLGPKDIHLDKHTFLQPLMFQEIGGVFSPTARHTHHSAIVNIAFSFSMSARRFWMPSSLVLA